MIGRYQVGDQPVPGFVLQAKLGEGSFGSVWSASGPGGSEVAIKVISLQRKYGDKELRALRLVKRVRHPNLVPLTGFWLLDEDGRLMDDSTVEELYRTSADPAATLVCADETAQPADLIVIMGLGDMSLEDRLRECQRDGLPGIPVDELLGYMEDAARAIDFLNKRQHSSDQGLVAIQHCDIKPQNILVVGGSAQICDLGLARILDDSRQTRAAFSAAYGAPECLTGSSPSPGTDQYSLAVSYVELRTGQLPFEDTSSHARVIQAHLDHRLDLSRLNSAEQVVIHRATSRDPADRFESVTAMVRALRSAVESAGKTQPQQRRSSRRVAHIMMTFAVASLFAIGFWKLRAHRGGDVLSVANATVGQEPAPSRDVPTTVPSIRPTAPELAPTQLPDASEASPPVSEVRTIAPESTIGGLVNADPVVDSLPAAEVDREPSFVFRWIGRRMRDTAGLIEPPFNAAIGGIAQSRQRLESTVIHWTFEEGMRASKEGNDRKAIAKFSSILQYDHQHAGSHTQRGLCLARLGQMDAALRDYDMAIEADARDADARRLRGILYAKNGQYNDALHDLNLAVEYDAQPAATCYRTRALVHLEMENFEAALADLEQFKACKIKSNHVLVLPLKVSRKGAFVEAESGQNITLEVGKAVRLVGINRERLKVEFQSEQSWTTGWIHQSFVQSDARL
jgi:serine/threonine protein kinase